MEVYLVRHGEAKPEAEDLRRPLSLRGREEVHEVARAAAQRGVQIFRILHSGKLRARQTAEILAEHLHPPGGVEESSGLSPDDDPVWARTELQAAPHGLILVGHLPHLARLAALLLGSSPDTAPVEFPPAAMLCLEHLPQCWKKNWMLTPQSQSSWS